MNQSNALVNWEKQIAERRKQQESLASNIPLNKNIFYRIEYITFNLLPKSCTKKYFSDNFYSLSYDLCYRIVENDTRNVGNESKRGIS